MYMYMYIYMYMYRYMYMYVCMHVCMHACMHVCMYACMHACTDACMYVIPRPVHSTPPNKTKLIFWGQSVVPWVLYRDRLYEP